MLVLSRKEGQEILIGDDVRIVIIGTDGSRVRIGIEAPNDRKIIRKEILNHPHPVESGEPSPVS